MRLSGIFQRIFIVPILFAGIVALQYAYDAQEASRAYTPLVIFPAIVLRVADLGLDSGLASLIWINSIQEIGAVSGSYPRLVNDIQTINVLDPKFAYPYAFAELVAPGLDPASISSAIEIGRSGVEYALPDWRIPFYLAFSYYRYQNDLANAIKYFHIAADTPGIPEGIRGTALNFGTQTDRRAQTKAIWASIYENTDDEILRSQAEASIARIDILDALERAIRIYKNLKGAYPSTTEDLVRAGIVSEIPPDPYGFTYTIEDDGTLKPRLGDQ